MGKACFCGILFLCCCCVSASCSVVYIVDIQGLPLQQRLAASVLVGLLNRHENSPVALGKINPNDDAWLATARAEEPALNASIFRQISSLSELGTVAVSTGAVLAKVLYAPEESWALPVAVTLAGLHRAVPVPASAASSAAEAAQFAALDALPVAFDARGQWADAEGATAWAWVNLYPVCHETDSLVVLQEPALLQAGYLADLVASRQLFAFHLPDMCYKGSASATLFEAMSEASRARGALLSVLGYFPRQEVVALCSQHHTEVSLVADYSSSLSFWSRLPPLAGPLLQAPPLPTEPYSPQRTYIAVVASDGDNMQMAFNVKRQRMQERLAACKMLGALCPPMTWTISNRLAEFAPTVLRWYFRQAALTGRDSFLLGPSGFGFLHPAIIDEGDPLLPAIVNHTLQAAGVLATSAYVHWDDYSNFGSASDDTVSQPRQQHANASSGGAAVTEQPTTGDILAVPAHFLGMERYAVPRQGVAAVPSNPRSGAGLGELAMERYLRRFEGTAINAVLSPIQPWVPARIGSLDTFRELHRWFGSEAPGDVAAQLARLPRGTLGYVYKIPDVGLNRVEELAKALPQHVQLVGYRELKALADQKHAAPEAALAAGEEAGRVA